MNTTSQHILISIYSTYYHSTFS